MKEIITLERIMDNGFGKNYCIQKQEFDLDSIHEYFEIENEFIGIDELLNFLNVKLNNDDFDFFENIKCNLDDSEDYDDFHSNGNPNGFGNDVDKLIVRCDSKILFEN